MFLPPALWGRWGCGGGSHSLLPLLTFPATPLSRNTLLLLFCVTRHYSVGFTTRWLSSETHKQTHAPTLDLVVRLLLCSTQHHLWMFYTHWRLPWRCGLIGPREEEGGGGGGKEGRQNAHNEEEERNKWELRGKCPPMNQQWQYIMGLAHYV